MAKKQDVDKVILTRLVKKNITVEIVGLSPLLMEKMDMDVVEKYNKIKGQKHVESDNRLEEEKVNQKIYYTSDNKVGVPAIAFLKGMTEVAPYIEGMDKKKVKGSIRVDTGIIPLVYKEQTVNVCWGKTSGMVRAPRKIIRPEFRDWSCRLNISYNADLISPENIINLLNLAGFQCGIGGWRPEKSGNYGQYEVQQG
jgi:hypothetical protein